MVSETSTTPRRVLVADDNPPVLDALSGLLGRWGYDVILARDGVEAWKVLQEADAPRVAILDWVMPRMDGLEVCRRVRNLRSTEPVYLIMLTGRGGREDLIAGLEGGADEYLAKPVDADELRARLLAAWRLVELQLGLAQRVRELETSPPLEVVGEDHPGLRETLRLCAATFTEALSVQGIPRHIRAALRTCRGLCTEALGGEEKTDGS